MASELINIELQSVTNRTNLRDVSGLSQVPLNEKSERNIFGEKIKLEIEFRKLRKIINFENINKFIYVISFFDIIVFLFYTIRLLEVFTDITIIALTPIFLANYFVSFVNCIGNIVFIDVHIKFMSKRSDKSNRKRRNSKRTNKMPKPLLFLKRIINLRFFSFIFYLVFYLLTVYLLDDYSYENFLNVALLILNYFFYFLEWFYYTVLVIIRGYEVEQPVEEEK
jgi:hypothetical protein